MDYKNGIIEDLGACIGAEATFRLVAIFGGRSIYVPAESHDNTTLARTLGAPAYAALQRNFGGESLAIPNGDEAFDRYRRIRSISLMIGKGLKPAEIARILGIKERQVTNYRAQAEQLGLLPTIFKSSTPIENCTISLF